MRRSPQSQLPGTHGLEHVFDIFEILVTAFPIPLALVHQDAPTYLIEIRDQVEESFFHILTNRRCAYTYSTSFVLPLPVVPKTTKLPVHSSSTWKLCTPFPSALCRSLQIGSLLSPRSAWAIPFAGSEAGHTSAQYGRSCVWSPPLCDVSQHRD